MRTDWAVVCVAAALCVPCSLVLGADPSQDPGITVTGAAEVLVAPDEVILTVGVETFHPDLKRAKEDNDGRTRRVLAKAQEFKIEPRHIQTSHLDMSPQYEHGDRRRRFEGYLLRKTIQIVLRDVPKFEGLVSGLLEAGITHIHRVQFRSTQDRKHRDEARLLAIKAAREKAVDMAGALGQKVGKPLTIREESSISFYWGSNWNWWGHGGWGSALNVAVERGGGAPIGDAATIALGQVQIAARVTVTFKLVDGNQDGSDGSALSQNATVGPGPSEPKPGKEAEAGDSPANRRCRPTPPGLGAAGRSQAAFSDGA
jgi:uncharacterized protein YggE